MQWGMPLIARGLITADLNKQESVELNAFEANLINNQQLVNLAY